MHGDDMMKVRIRYFASLREKMQSEYGEYELGENPTVRDLQRKIEEQNPGIFGGSRVLISVNYRYAEPEDRINDDDEIAVMPMASGG